MKLGIEKIVGKTIKTVVLTEQSRTPCQQLYLLFTDGASLEFYGESFQCTNDLYSDSVAKIVSSAEYNHATKIQVIDKEE